MRILVTNDDGVDSVGLRVLAARLAALGEVVVAAPDREYSGAGAAIGTLHLIEPEVHQIEVPGASAAWAVTGPPALCVLFARLGVYGGPFDLVVSGINPGVNAGRAVYHSGTVGAALTARNGGVSGIAVSQAVEGFGVEGQGWDEMLSGQHWDTAAEVAAAVVDAWAADRPADPVVLNVNVPNVALVDLHGWRRTEVAGLPPRTLAAAHLEPKVGHDGTFRVRMSWGDPLALPPSTDSGAVEAGLVSITMLSRLADAPGVDLPALGAALTARSIEHQPA
jgi:5'-nucleotidase